MSGTVELKTFSSFEIKSPDTGEVEAIVATLNVVDKDGDVILPGAIPDGAKVKLSAYGHDILKEDAPPAGVGTISVKGDKAHFNGRFFMTTARGRDAFHTVKELGADGEWSFGFLKALTKTAPMTSEWLAKGARRLITSLVPAEASPVLIGAGYGTGTLFTKAGQLSPGGAEIDQLASDFDRIVKENAPAPMSQAEFDVGLKSVIGPTVMEVKVDAERHYAAKCVAEWCAMKWEVAPPTVKWYNAKDRPRANGFWHPRDAESIWLCSDLSSFGEILRVAAHETSHYARSIHRLSQDEAEVKADTSSLMTQYAYSQFYRAA